MQTKDGNPLSGEFNTELKEKITRRSAVDEERLRLENQWFAYLKDGRKRKKPSIGKRKSIKGKHYIYSAKQQKRIIDGKRGQVFLGALNRKQRKALLNGE